WYLVSFSTRRSSDLDYLKLKEGDEVRCTGRLLEVPVGPGMLGRVVNALGQPVDGRGPIASSSSRAVEMVAPGIIVRQPVKEPLQDRKSTRLNSSHVK